MKIKLVNSVLTFAKADVENITSLYTLTLGYNGVSGATSNITAAVKRDSDTYPNLTSYFNEGYNRIKVTPKENVKYIRQPGSSSGAGISAAADPTWVTEETIINVDTELASYPTFATLRLTLRYVLNGVEQDVTSMSDSLADWVTITLSKESSNN